MELQKSINRNESFRSRRKIEKHGKTKSVDDRAYLRTSATVFYSASIENFARLFNLAGADLSAFYGFSTRTFARWYTYRWLFH